MAWLWTGTTFEMGEERKKRRDETPAWRSYCMQEKTAAEAEFEDWIILDKRLFEHRLPHRSMPHT